MNFRDVRKQNLRLGKLTASKKNPTSQIYQGRQL